MKKESYQTIQPSSSPNKEGSISWKLDEQVYERLFERDSNLVRFQKHKFVRIPDEGIVWSFVTRVLILYEASKYT